jgi:hypothetical protein
MGYVSDWAEAENEAAAARAAHPLCTEDYNCPAGDNPAEHLLTCWRFRLANRVVRGLIGTFQFGGSHG